MRLLSASDVDEAGLQKLTGVDTPVAGVLEQNMFYVNQVMRFGKLMAVFQPNPADAKSTITTVMIALAVGSSTLDQKKKYENVPVLRNLVPSQVLLGNSSFNTGNSISAGLPSYVRNRIKAIAGDSRSRLTSIPFSPRQRPASAGRFVCIRKHRLGVIAGLDPGIHEAARRRQRYRKSAIARVASWIAGSSPAMTAECDARSEAFRATCLSLCPL